MSIDDKMLQRLLAAADRQEIENVLGTYCRALDRLDLQLLKSVYHPDGFDDHGSMQLNAHDFAERILAKIRDVCVYGMHTVTHNIIDVRGDQATSEAYYVALHITAPGEEAIGKFFGPKYLEEQRRLGTLDKRHEYVCGGRYLDVFHKRDGIWRIYRRKMTNEFAICRPESNSDGGIPAAFFTGSRRDEEDPVYALQQGWG